MQGTKLNFYPFIYTPPFALYLIAKGIFKDFQKPAPYFFPPLQLFWRESERGSI
jgi:hypothetical protein